MSVIVPPGPGKRRSQAIRATVVCVLSVLAVAGLDIIAPPNNAAMTFLAELALLLLALCSLGVALNGRPAGFAIDARNRVSLSKLQMLAWTVLVVAGVSVIGAYSLHIGGWNELKLCVHNELLTAMGISVASFVATPTILSLKAAEAPSEQSVETMTAANNAGDPAATPTNIGKVDVRATPAQARWSDLFRGDLVGDGLALDLSKVQQIAITLLLLGLYAGGIYSHLTKNDWTLPAFNYDFVKLMAVSHAGYLLYKAAPRTSNGDPGATTPQPNVPLDPPGANTAVG